MYNHNKQKLSNNPRHNGTTYKMSLLFSVDCCRAAIPFEAKG